jgi:hypothetical protein
VDVDQEYRVALKICLERYEQMIGIEHGDILDFITEFKALIRENPVNKLNRWLGYIQGVLIERGVTTVEAERDFTRLLFRPLDFPWT